MQQSIVEPVEEATIASLETLKLLTNSLRLRLVEVLQDEPKTVKQLASVLDEPQTKLYRHVQLLEEGGIVRVVDERLVSGITEKTYWLTARHFVLDRSLLSSEEGKGVDRVLGHFLDTVRRDLRRAERQNLFDTQRTAPDPNALLLRHGYAQLDKARAGEFYTRLLELTREFASTPTTEDVAWYALGVVLHPCSAPQEEEES